MTARHLITLTIEDADYPDGNDGFIQNPAVPIIHLFGDDYETAVDEINDMGGSTLAAVEYLSRWDYGQENDDATATLGFADMDWVQSRAHHTHKVGNLRYWLLADHHLPSYALYRAPLVA